MTLFVVRYTHHMTATEKVTVFLEQLSRATALLEKMLKVVLGMFREMAE